MTGPQLKTMCGFDRLFTHFSIVSNQGIYTHIFTRWLDDKFQQVTQSIPSHIDSGANLGADIALEAESRLLVEQTSPSLLSADH